MNSPSYLTMIRRDKARAEAQRKREAHSRDLIESIIAALLAVLVGLIAV